MMLTQLNGLQLQNNSPLLETAGVYAGVGQTMGHGLTHVPEESGALIEAPADETAILTSKRFFRYQPGRVSSATFGVKTTLLDDKDLQF